jgi:phage tail-like protein
MNVNGSQFFHMLGKADWGACTVPLEGTAKTLSSIWKLFPGGGGNADIPLWNAAAGLLTLAETGGTIPPTQGEPRLRKQDRRASACDRFGNLYAIGDDRKSITVANAGEGNAHAFWPDDRVVPTKLTGDFADAVALDGEALSYSAMTVSTANYLIVAANSASKTWLLRFDLVGGGAPMVHDITVLVPDTVIDLAADHCDGIWLLHEGGISRLGPDLQSAAGPALAPEQSAFQPADGGNARLVEKMSVAPPVAIPAGCTGLQLQITALGELILLAENAAGVSQIHVFPTNALDWKHLRDLPQTVHVMAVGPAVTEPGETTDVGEALYLVTDHGNQALLFRLDRDDDGLVVSITPEPAIIPLRRFGGRGLQLRGAAIVYDSGTTDPLWVPLMAQIRRRYATENRLVTAIFDADEPQCIWDRIRLDATIPPGTEVLIEARAHDEEAVLAAMGENGWQTQPGFYLNSDGGELSGKRAIAALPTDMVQRQGCWDLLLQQVAGRFIELRITLKGDGRHTPALRSMRIWYPRFSYTERFLPALYREDAVSGSFVDRFLASMEGINTVIEGRIATAQAQFDPRTARTEMLEWLAGWFDVMLDPAWPESRRRLFLAHATEFFGWRGTIAGLKLALRLAFDQRLSGADFRFGWADCSCPGTIRIVEAFSVQPKGHKIVKAGPAPSGPASRILQGPWSSAEGAAGLVARLPEGSDWSPTNGRFPLFAPQTGAEDWQRVVQQNFGFVPVLGAAERKAWQDFQQAESGKVDYADLPNGSVAVGAAELWSSYLQLPSRVRTRWQRYLQNRYRSLDAINREYLANWGSFDEIPLPDYLPANEKAVEDWLLFEGQLYPRQLGAHRFSVLIPLASVNANAETLAAQMALAQRIIAIEKPAHTTFDVRFFWAMNRVGEARIGQDTEIGSGSRAPELIPPAIVGQAYLGSNFVGGPQGRVDRRERLSC